MSATVLRSPGCVFLVRLLFPGLVLLTLACTSPAAPVVPESRSVPSAKCAVQVITRTDGNRTHFLVANHELCEVTMSFAAKLVNLKPSLPLPHTATFPAGAVTEAFSVAPLDPNAEWDYAYTNSFKLGSNRVRHDDHCVYELPFAAGERVEVTQGYNGGFSHKGQNKYAIDWQVPQGTLVCAARGGLVVRTKDDSDRGGASMDYDSYNNYVLIRHEDGTLGQYCHLQKGGVLVKPGQEVVAGDPIAHSGNTGFSTGPHLHFCVLMAKNGGQFATIPVKFRTAEAPALTLVMGHAYQAAKVSVAALNAPESVLPKTARVVPDELRAKTRAGTQVSLGMAFFHWQH